MGFVYIAMEWMGFSQLACSKCWICIYCCMACGVARSVYFLVFFFGTLSYRVNILLKYSGVLCMSLVYLIVGSCLLKRADGIVELILPLVT